MTNDTNSHGVGDPITPRQWIWRGFFGALGVLLLGILALAVQTVGTAAVTIATPFVVGWAVTLLIDPLARRLQSRHLGRTASVLLVFSGFIVLTFGSAYLTVPVLINQASQLATQGPASIETATASLTKSTNAYLDKHRKLGPIPLPKSVNAAMSNVAGKVSDALQRSAGSVATFALNSSLLVLECILGLIIAFYLLADYDRLRARLFFLMPAQYRHWLRIVLSDVGEVFAQYVRGMVILCILYSITILAWLEALGLRYPLLAGPAMLVGALAGMLYAVPYIGPGTIALLAFIVAFTAGGFKLAVGAVIGCLVLTQLFDAIVSPRIVGGGVGLHPVLTMFALSLGGTLFGVWGFLLSVPIAASIQVILFRLIPKLREPTPPEFSSLEPPLPVEPPEAGPSDVAARK
ncbi:MAG: AI-2E family transporter [Capsulimonadaceae bacterium]